MTRPASLAGDPRVRWAFLVNTYSTGWFWYPRGVGFLYCMDGLLQFEPIGTMPFRSPEPYQHTAPRVLLLSPLAIPNHFTVVVFEGGEVSVSIARNKAQIRTTMTECGFEVVDAPPQRMYPFNQRKVWEKHMGPTDRGAAHVTSRVLTEQLPQGTVMGGVDNPMTVNVRCLACGGPVELKYHDIQSWWYAANASPQTKPGWQPFNFARPICDGETPLDMSCPACASPMRVIVRADEWRMSLWLYYVIEVLTIAPGYTGA